MCLSGASALKTNGMHKLKKIWASTNTTLNRSSLENRNGERLKLITMQI